MTADCRTTAVFFSDLLPERVPRLWADLVRALRDRGHAANLLSGTRDVWVRDFLPVQTAPDRFVQFRYAPDYLRGFGDVRTDPARVTGLPAGVVPVSCPLVLDGGSVVGCPGRAVVTDKVYAENPGLERRQVRERLRAALGAGELIVVPKEPYDVFGHADGLVRFLAPDRVLVNDHSGTDPAYAARLERALLRHGLRVERLPYRPEFARGDDGVPSAVGNALNFLWLGDLVLLPAYALDTGRAAARLLGELLPGTEVVPLDCTDLARYGGVLNCCSWTADLSGLP